MDGCEAAQNGRKNIPFCIPEAGRSERASVLATIFERSSTMAME
jgi:hypothetical protein